MRARVPQDVDLEDRLVFGLSPTRFGYLVIAALVALSLWRLDGLPSELRAPACWLALGAGAVLAWGRWVGRNVDCWLVDVAVFAARNYRLWAFSRPRWRRRGTAACQPVALVAINALALPAPGPARPPALPSAPTSLPGLQAPRPEAAT